jgi:hypothetical protein
VKKKEGGLPLLGLKGVSRTSRVGIALARLVVRTFFHHDFMMWNWQYSLGGLGWSVKTQKVANFIEEPGIAHCLIAGARMVQKASRYSGRVTLIIAPILE